MRLNSIRFKISILFVAILGTILVIHSTILYLSLRYTLYKDLDAELRMKVEQIVSTINAYLEVLGEGEDTFLFAVKRVITLQGEHPHKQMIEEFEAKWLQKVDTLDLREHFITFSGIDGTSIVRSENVSEQIFYAFLKKNKPARSRRETMRTINVNGNRLRIISIPFVHNNTQEYLLQVGTPLKPIIYILNNRLFYIAISIPVILFFAGFIGQLFAVRIMKPVVEVAKTAQGITHENLSERVKAEHVDEEMKYLVDSFNDMIERLEGSFNYIVEMSSHIAHELKTPLAIIRGESELALRKEQADEEYRRVIAVTIQEVERMLKTINDLLLLTKLEYRQDIFKFERIDLRTFFMEIYEQTKILASRKEIEVTFTMAKGPLYLNGDTLHLRRLFFNIIDNALKFTSRKGGVVIDIRRAGKDLSVVISDTGVGIPKDDLPEIFKRFFHVDRTGRKEEPGIGLGLSIALSIARIHHGDIRVESEVGKGTTFTVILPLI